MRETTKIIATVGLWGQDLTKMRSFWDAGVSIARLNFSHGNHDFFNTVFQNIKQLESEGYCCPLLQDLQGPKIRIGDMTSEPLFLKAGERVALTSKPLHNGELYICPDIPGILEVKTPPPVVLVDDGKIKLIYQETKKGIFYYASEQESMILPRKGLSFPGSKIPISALSDKDKEDLKLGLKNKIDWVALSFVQTAEDIRNLKKILRQYTDREVGIVAKIETRTALDHLDEILAESDGVMIARGDLSLEIGYESVPKWQDHIIARARAKRKWMIVATQLMESVLTYNDVSLSDIADICRAVKSGTDMVMLSGETAMHPHPDQIVRKMKHILASNPLVVQTLITQLSEESFDQAWWKMVIQWGESQQYPIVIDSGVPISIDFLSHLRSNVPIFIRFNKCETVKKWSAYRGILPYNSQVIKGNYLFVRDRYHTQVIEQGDNI